MLELLTTRNNPMIDPVLHVWGWEIPVYLFLGGWVAGAMVLSGWLMRRDPGAGRPSVWRVLPWVGLVLSGPRRNAWAREGLRLAPLVLLLVLPLAFPFALLSALPPLAVVALVAGAVAGWIGWVGLRFFTHGAAPRHDRLTGFQVTAGH